MNIIRRNKTNKVSRNTYKSLNEWAKNHMRFVENFLNVQIQIDEGLHQLQKLHTIKVDNSGNVLLGSTFEYKKLTYCADDSVAPEIDVVRGLEAGIKISDLAEDIFDKRPFLQTLDNVFYNYSLDGFINSLDTDDLKVLKTYEISSEIWSLGHMLYILYMNAIADPDVLDSEFYRINHRLQMKIFEGMLQADPRKRFSIDMVLNELYTMKMDSAFPDN